MLLGDNLERRLRWWESERRAQARDAGQLPGGDRAVLPVRPWSRLARRTPRAPLLRHVRSDGARGASRLGAGVDRHRLHLHQGGRHVSTPGLDQPAIRRPRRARGRPATAAPPSGPPPTSRGTIGCRPSASPICGTAPRPCCSPPGSRPRSSPKSSATPSWHSRWTSTPRSPRSSDEAMKAPAAYILRRSPPLPAAE